METIILIKFIIVIKQTTTRNIEMHAHTIHVTDIDYWSISIVINTYNRRILIIY